MYNIVMLKDFGMFFHKQLEEDRDLPKHTFCESLKVKQLYSNS